MKKLLLMPAFLFLVNFTGLCWPADHHPRVVTAQPFVGHVDPEQADSFVTKKDAPELSDIHTKQAWIDLMLCNFPSLLTDSARRGIYLDCYLIPAYQSLSDENPARERLVQIAREVSDYTRPLEFFLGQEYELRVKFKLPVVIQTHSNFATYQAVEVGCDKPLL